MPGLTRRRLALILLSVLTLTLLSCKRETYPGAPEGYDYTTLQVKWAYEGEKTGTRELYVETKGFEDGQLLYKRMADIRDTVAKHPARPDKTFTDNQYYFNIDGTGHAVMRQMGAVAITRMDIAPIMRAHRHELWQPVMLFLIRREDLTTAQRTELQSKLYRVTDEDLLEVGATINEEEFMGQKVKHYVVPVADGKAEIWMYGDITLKRVLESNWRGMGVKSSVEATEFKLNEKLPEKIFTIPEGYEIKDNSKPTEEN